MPLLELLASIVIVAALLVGSVALLYSVAQFLSTERLRLLRPNAWPMQWNLWHLLTAAAVAALIILAMESGVALVLAVSLISLLVLAWFVRTWSREFMFLMGLRDDELPSRNDKLIWVMVLFLFGPIGPLLFRSYRVAHWPEPARDSQVQTHAEPTGHSNAAAHTA